MLLQKWDVRDKGKKKTDCKVDASRIKALGTLATLRKEYPYSRAHILNLSSKENDQHAHVF